MPRVASAIEKLNKSLSHREMTIGRDSIEHMVEFVTLGSRLAASNLHGVTHWMSVYRNALTLAHDAKFHMDENSADSMGMVPVDFSLVALLFALFHDCRRVSEGPDDTHGAYGAAALAAYTRHVAPLIEYDIAIAACAMHTVVQHPNDEQFRSMSELNCFTPTPIPSDAFTKAIGMCLSADRMDLMRPGLNMMFERRYMHSYDKCITASNKLIHECGAWTMDVWFDEHRSIRS
jgi:hypothetical protein